jgi:hypothetical protein
VKHNVPARFDNGRKGDDVDTLRDERSKRAADLIDSLLAARHVLAAPLWLKPSTIGSPPALPFLWHAVTSSIEKSAISSPRRNEGVRPIIVPIPLTFRDSLEREAVLS